MAKIGLGWGHDNILCGGKSVLDGASVKNGAPETEGLLSIADT
jgi:hypothetical protein